MYTDGSEGERGRLWLATAGAPLIGVVGWAFAAFFLFVVYGVLYFFVLHAFGWPSPVRAVLWLAPWGAIIAMLRALSWAGPASPAWFIPLVTTCWIAAMETPLGPAGSVFPWPDMTNGEVVAVAAAPWLAGLALQSILLPVDARLGNRPLAIPGGWHRQSGVPAAAPVPAQAMAAPVMESFSPPAPAGTSGRRVVVDASNVILTRMEGGTGNRIDQLELLLDELQDQGHNAVAYLDSKMYGKLTQVERDAKNLLERQGRLMMAPPGVEADRLMIDDAEASGAVLVTNDRMVDYWDGHPWLRDPARLKRFQFPNGQLKFYDANQADRQRGIKGAAAPPVPTSATNASQPQQAPPPAAVPDAMAEFTDSSFSYADIIGLEGAKQAMTDAVNIIRDPATAKLHGLKPGVGILLHGPPGTGKTHFARCTAGQFGLPLFEVASLKRKYSGGTEALIEEIFRYARTRAPGILFFDEFDAIAQDRSKISEGSSFERGYVNALLAALDGLSKSTNKPLIVIGATNYKEVLDPAVLRPGRFDKHVAITLPSYRERFRYLCLLLRGRTEAADFDLRHVVAGTEGYSPAEIQQLVQEVFTAIYREEPNAPPRALRTRDFELALQSRGIHQIGTGRGLKTSESHASR